MQISREQYNKLPERLQKCFYSGNFHCTTKPIALLKYLITLVSKEGQTVLDPFLGSGSTGLACKELNRNFVGIEISEEYMKIAECRMNSVIKENTLF
ncbi:site-specific DNA-methyltransferase [Candidatus Pacearchaeota archaeon]|nr:site-specific DNA-methyltransferase [Candidatus Pacearchaeota archaeon]